MIFVKNSRGGREGGQHDQHFVKNRVGGRGSTSIWIMSLIYWVFFGDYPFGTVKSHTFIKYDPPYSGEQ